VITVSYRNAIKWPCNLLAHRLSYADQCIADATTPWPAAVNYWMAAPKLDRSLYILVHDDQVQAADPDDKLYFALSLACCLSIVDAKKLNAESTSGSRRVFRDVPEAARDRFLQLVHNTEVTGTRMNHVLQYRWLCPEICFVNRGATDLR
jgi:hypothetical protein